MLIEKYDLEIFTPPCEPGAERFSTVARLTVDISEVLPYLNATLRGAIYSCEANALTWTKGGHYIASHSYEVATSNVEDRQAAEKELKGLIDLVNRTWERRAEITPDYEMHQRPTPLAIYKPLPQTNCKQCGEPNIAGIHDMARALKTTGHSRIPSLVCINKADIYAAGTAEIEAYCHEHNIKVCGYIPFDETVTEAMIHGEPVTAYRPNAPASRAMIQIWQDVAMPLAI